MTDENKAIEKSKYPTSFGLFCLEHGSGKFLDES